MMKTQPKLRIAFEYGPVAPYTCFSYMSEGYCGNAWELSERLLKNCGSALAITVHVNAAGRWWFLDRVTRAMVAA